MTNTIEAIAATRKKARVGNYKLPLVRSACVEIANLSTACRRIVTLVALCLAVGFISATAQAQELFIHAPAQSAATTPDGWWSPETASFAAAPHLLLSMADVGHFQGSGSLRTSTAQSSNYRVTFPMNYSIVNLGDFGLAPEARAAESRSLAYGDLLPPDSLFSLVQSKYTLWESSLADSRSLTNVNGVSVYPLVEVTYADWHLPIILYVPPRDSEAR